MLVKLQMLLALFAFSEKKIIFAGSSPCRIEFAKLGCLSVFFGTEKSFKTNKIVDFDEFCFELLWRQFHRKAKALKVQKIELLII